MNAPAHGALRQILEAERKRIKCSRADLTVLSNQVDPYRLDTPAGRLRWFHGSADDPADRINLQQDPISLTKLLQRHRCTILSCGGSHVPYFRKVASAGWVVNPGSVGLSLNGEPGADYALVRIDGDGVDVRMDKVEYDVAAVAFDIVAWGLPAVIAEAVQRGRMPEGGVGDRKA